jgi:putative ABC transport system permease protein
MNFLTELREGLWISWDAIRAHKMRATLTTLGIIIGVVTVTLMTTAIEGIKGSFLQSLSSLGAGTLYVSRIDWFIDSAEQWLKQNKRPQITLAQIHALERLMPSAHAIAPYAETGAPVKYKNHKADSVRVGGTTEQFLQTGGATMADGRFFSAEESDGARPVCVLGCEVATNLFAGSPAVGTRITVGPAAFEVVGVLEKQGESPGPTQVDNNVFIPVGQFTAGFWRNPDFTIRVLVGDLTRIDDAKEELRGALRRIRRIPPGAEDDFAINSQGSFLDMFNRVGGTMAAIGLFITGLALFVGGIGIMNIMFVSVAERTKEIGIRKAIGAKRRTILIQFLSEAASICLLGGLIALAIAWPATLLLGRFMPATMSLPTVGVALLVSLLTGIISGFVPAWRAARMNPVDALRSE